MKKLLILSHNYTSDRVAGISIRFLEIAKALGRKFDVTLALANSQGFKSDSFNIAQFKSESDILSLFRRHDAVLTRGIDVVSSRKLYNFDIPMIFDLLCFFFFEGLESGKDTDRAFGEFADSDIGLMRKLSQRGDFFICANENQRNFWLALLFEHKRIVRTLYNEDSSLKNLIGIVPFGLSSEKPFHAKKSLKNVIKGVKDSDKIVLWFGGIWDWLDPLSPIRAMQSICKKRDDIKLFFIGGKHPSPASRPHDMQVKVMDMARSYGLLDKNVFFIDWVPYEERANYLLESDIGIVTHSDNLETKFSWRTRVLDYLWAELPVILTKGDPMSGLIESRGLGMTVEYNDPSGIESAILRIADDRSLSSKMKDNIRNIKSELSWDNVVLPIADFCNNPHRTSNIKRSFLGAF